MSADQLLQGRVALVTGASRGIGAAIATKLAHAGADVAITARDAVSLRETAVQIEATGRRCWPAACDVTNAESIDEAVTRIEAGLGSIDILINNAGVNIPRLALDATEAEWDTILDTNLKGAFLCAQRVGPTMIEQRQGRIVNISSAAGLIPVLERVAYCTSKAGLIMLTRVLALEWAQYGITVNAIAPTFVETELAAQTLNRPGEREFWENAIPLGRLATTDDVAAAVRYLASPDASFVTGEVLAIDGGLTMR